MKKTGLGFSYLALIRQKKMNILVLPLLQGKHYIKIKFYFVGLSIYYLSSFYQDWKFFKENHMQTDQKVSNHFIF